MCVCNEITQLVFIMMLQQIHWISINKHYPKEVSYIILGILIINLGNLRFLILTKIKSDK
jgi:hypothetical protein